MAATVVVEEGNGAGPAWTDISTSIGGHLCSADNNNPGTSYPIKIPSSGTNYSYWKSHRLAFSGTFTSIENIKIYTDGSLGWGTGVTVKFGDTDTAISPPVGLTNAQYIQATGTEGETGDEMVANHTNINSSGDLFSYTSGSPLLVDDSTYTSAGDSKHIVIQEDVADTASSGQKTAETITWQWDEVA